MINKYAVKRFCNEDISLIENYNKAISDPNTMWQCHHRKGTIVSKKDLIENGEYYNRPATELIFLTQKEHKAIHCSLKFKGKQFTDEHKRKLAEAKKGKMFTEETKQKISIAKKGIKRKPFSEEWKRKMSIARKGKSLGRCWFNNGIKNVFVKECPEGFVRGRIKRVKQS